MQKQSTRKRNTNATTTTLVGVRLGDDRKIDKTKSPDVIDKIRVLKIMNGVAFVIHIISFIVALVLSIINEDKSLSTEVTTDFINPANGSNVVGVQSLGFYKIIWVDLPFPLITAIFHLIIAFVPTVNSYYNNQVFNAESNPLRWLEYAITASLMTYVILQLSGVTNLFLLLLVGVVCNVILQAQGYLMEKYNPPLAKANNNVDWWPTLIGWIIFVFQWVVIWVYFSVTVSNVGSAPGYVWAIIFGLFFQFSLFGLVQLLHYLPYQNFLSSIYAVEIAYITLSLTSKLFLTWTLQLGIIINPSDST